MTVLIVGFFYLANKCKKVLAEYQDAPYIQNDLSNNVFVRKVFIIQVQVSY